MDQAVTTIIASAVLTLAVIAAFLRNESAISGLSARMDALSKDVNARFDRVDQRFETLTRDMNYRFETLVRRIDKVDSDLREWAKTSMQ